MPDHCPERSFLTGLPPQNWNMRAFSKPLTAIALLAAPAGAAAQESPEESPQTTVYGPQAEVAQGKGDIQPVAIPDPLDRAATLAAATHPLVQAAEAESDALDADLRTARFQRYPSLSVEALAATEGSSFADQDGLALNAVLEQPIWSGGRIGGEIERARAARRVGENRVDESQRDIVIRVVSAYYEYVIAAERIAVLEASVAQHNELLAAIGRRVEREVSPLADLTLGRSRTAQVELDLASAMESRDSARLRLLQLTGGVEIDPVLPPSGVSRSLPPEENALAEALGCSPSLRALQNLVDVAQAQRDVAQANFWPQLLAQVSQNEITGTRAALVLRAQLGPGLSNISQLEASDARILRALAEFGENERNLREQLSRDYVVVRAAERRIAAGVLAADAADDIIASYQRQFIAGRRSWLDVMNAVREAANARLTESDARVSAAAASARILAVSCRWQPDEALPTPEYTTSE